MITIPENRDALRLREATASGWVHTMASSLKSALKNMLKGDLKPDQRAHLDRWARDWADDPVWPKVKAAARSVHPRWIYVEIIMYAIQARVVAEGVRFGQDPILEADKKRRDKLLAVADKADDVARHFAWAEQISGFLRREAQDLRQRAGREPRPTTRISRQARGRIRPRSREYGAFMRLMVEHMRYLTGKPQYHAVAEATNAAFPDADVTDEDVRSACRPSTRSARTPQETGALSR
jgi:hypothetical protein